MRPFHLRPIDPTSETEVERVAQGMRATLIEVEGEATGTALYTMDWLRERVRWHLDPQQATAAVLLAEDPNREFLGHTIVRWERTDRGQPYGLISTTYVVPTARRLGVASALLLAGEAWFEAQGLHQFATWTSSTNTKLLRLYEKHGYTQTETHVHETTGTLMVKLEKSPKANKFGPLVSVPWLQANLSDPRLVILDTSLAPIGASHRGSGQGGAAPLPGARYFDLESKFSDITHMMPSATTFEREARLLGIRKDSRIVLYDNVGIYSSARVWWMFRAMGHDDVAVLEGGLPAWQRLSSAARHRDTSPVVMGDFVALPRPLFFCDSETVARALDDEHSTVIDARSKARFDGTEPEPRLGLRCGHMPGSRNIPFSSVVHEGYMRPQETLREVFAAQISGRRKLIISCGSGVTACIVALAAELCGLEDIQIYDGSWSEWGRPSSRPIATNPITKV